MITLFYLIRNKFMHVMTYLPNFAPPHFAARSIPKTPHTAQWKVTLLTFLCCLFSPFGWSNFLFSIHKAHTFARPDTFCKVWKRLGNAVPIGEILLLPVRLRGVKVTISCRTKFHLKVSSLFPCAVEEG